MTISVGDAIPSVKLMQATPEGPKEVSTDEIFAEGRTVVLFAVPGAFTPTCSAKHLPGFQDSAGEIKAKGVDEIVCLAVNDAFVMGAWAQSCDVKSDITMLADGSGNLTKALGLELDATGFGMGLRSKRFSMIVKDGKVTHLNVEEGAGFEVSKAEVILEQLG